jgi:hypothetical protein
MCCNGKIDLGIAQMPPAATILWLQLDVDTGEVRLRVNEEDRGIIHTLAPGFARPVYPTVMAQAFLYQQPPPTALHIRCI